MSAFVESMAYANERPWHGLGVKVGNDMTPEEILIAAGLDWTVSKRELYFRKALVEGQPATMRIVPDEFALIRDSDESVLDTVGSNFKPVQNREVFEFFERFVKAGDMKMETAGSLKNGKFIWALARFGESVTIAGQDQIDPYILLSQPHQFGFSMTAALTPICVVCWNTLNYALGTNLDGSNTRASFRMPHSRAFDDEVKASAEQALGLASSNMQAFTHTAELLASKSAKEAEVVEYFYEVARIDQGEELVAELLKADEEKRGAMLLENLMEENGRNTVKRFHEAWQSAPGQDLSARKNTWWGAVNAVTYCADHVMSHNADNRLTSAWYGRTAGMKRRAVELAVERVNGAAALDSALVA